MLHNRVKILVILGDLHSSMVASASPTNCQRTSSEKTIKLNNRCQKVSPSEVNVC